MSEANRSKGVGVERSEREELGRERRAAWRELRARQREQGMEPRRRATLSNGKAEWRTVEEEAAARQRVVEEHGKVWRAVLPVLLRKLGRIPDPRNPRSIKHKLVTLLLYGLLMFVLRCPLVGKRTGRCRGRSCGRAPVSRTGGRASS